MEHTIARRNVTSLEDAKESFMSGNAEALNTIFESTQALAGLYPKHIEKEDKRFFYHSMEYFSKQEQEDMYRKFQEFTRYFTDKRYSQIISSLM